MKPILLIMAAGLGSRYGGLKQIDKIGPNGEVLLELAVHDAIKAGFEKIVFILRKEIEAEFKNLIGNKLEKYAEVKYAIQEIENLPKGYKVPNERTKPWGTGQAILCARDIVDAPFVVINADDFYGQEAFRKIYEFLINNKDENTYGMIGYKLSNTLSENGHVARGVCKVKSGYLEEVVERTKIIKKGEAAFYTEDDENWAELDYNSTVSMNMWALQPGIFEILERKFKEFLSQLDDEDIKAEYLLPTIIGDLLKEEKADVTVLKSLDNWFGVTYQEDKQSVIDSIKELISAGIYPDKLY